MKHRDRVTQIIEGDYACNRVWSAWGYGTMTADDFVDLADTERVDEIITYGDERVRDALFAIRGIANDMAWIDPNNDGNITQYMGNAITIYEEWSRGENYERVDVNKFGLKTINKLNKERDKST